MRDADTAIHRMSGCFERGVLIAFVQSKPHVLGEKNPTTIRKEKKEKKKAHKNNNEQECLKDTVVCIYVCCSCFLPKYLWSVPYCAKLRKVILVMR